MRSCPRCKTPYTTSIEFCGIDGEKLVEHDTDPLIGATIDRYRVVERLGGGGMAAVYRAVHTVIDRECALKVLYGELASDATFVGRFRREAQTASRIKHENVVDILDFGTTPEGASFLLMELLQGKTLGAVIAADGAMPPPRAALLLRDVALGLAAAHACGFIHRDLKPGNIMLVDERGRQRAKILDFGLVSHRDKQGSDELTATGQTLGTPSYMAPEQIRGLACTERSDLYSLGVILYEMIAGKRPFRGSVGEVLGQHTTAPPPPLAPAGGLETLALRMLEKEPADRPASAAAIVRALEELGLLEDGPAALPVAPPSLAERSGSQPQRPPAGATGSSVPLLDDEEVLTEAQSISRVPVGAAQSVQSVQSIQNVQAAQTAQTAPTRVMRASRLSTRPGSLRQAALALVIAGAVVAGVVVFGERAEDLSRLAPDAHSAAVKAGAKAIEAVLAEPTSAAKAKADAAAALELARARAEDDVATALGRRGLTRPDAEGVAGLRAHFKAFDAAQGGADAAGVGAAAAALVREIARVAISERMLRQRLERIASALDTRTLSKERRASIERDLERLRASARRGAPEAERSKAYLDAARLEEAIGPAPSSPRGSTRGP